MNNDVKVIAIAIYSITDAVEIRFQRQDDGTWKPDLMVNHVTQEVTSPPTCFTPTDEVIAKLDGALIEMVDGVLEHIELHVPGESPDPGWMNE